VRRAATALLTAALTSVVPTARWSCRTGTSRPCGSPITLGLPAVVHRFEPDHRPVVVLAGGDLACRGSTAPQPVTLVTGPGRTQQLTVPVTG
jgi:hypothetical protein